MLAWTTLAAAAAALAMTTGAAAQTGHAAHCSGAGRCVVTVSVAPGKPCTDPANITVSPDPVEMGAAGARSIVWRLDRGYEFCPASGDGVPFKTGNLDFQFFDAARTDNADGDDDHGPPDRCRKNFRWKNKNEPHTAGRTYEYLLKFTGPGGQSCVKDPFIRNG